VRKNKYYFISDTHLGFPDHKTSLEREKKLVNFLLFAEKDAKAIYLLGDIFDFWYEYKYVVPKYYVRLLGTLAMMVDRGVEIHFFCGNHDQWLKNYFQKEIGLIVHKAPLTIDIDGKIFFIHHGDGLNKKDWKYRLMQRLFGNKFLRFLFSALHPRWAMALGVYWSKISRQSHLREENFDYQEGEQQYQFCISYLKNHKVDYFIFGHRHLEKVWSLPYQSKLYVLSDWITSNGYFVWEGENLEAKKFE
jgi:UDP-2,3-diacylglucosamine hydrolase